MTCRISIMLLLAAAITGGAQSFGDGTHLIGTDISAGTYRAPGGEYCMWERLSGLSGAMSDYIAGDVPTGRAIVEIKPTDKAFKTQGCGTWSAIGEGSGEAPAIPQRILSAVWLSLFVGFMEALEPSPDEMQSVLARATRAALLETRDWTDDDTLRVIELIRAMADGLVAADLMADRVWPHEQFAGTWEVETDIGPVVWELLVDGTTRSGGEADDTRWWHDGKMLRFNFLSIQVAPDVSEFCFIPFGEGCMSYWKKRE